MPTFNIVLDKRVKKKNDQYNLTIRMVNGNDVMYLNITNMTEKQYEQIFIKKTKDENSIQFRETCNGYISKCERLFSELKPFDKKKFIQLFFQKDESSDDSNQVSKPSESMLLSQLFTIYISKKELKIRTKTHYKMTITTLEKFQPLLTVYDVTPVFLKFFEKEKLDSGWSLATVNSHYRNLRSVLNYFMNEDKIISKHYQYPFAKGGYSISSYFPQKLVLKNDEIQKVISFSNFDNKEQEYARDIWVFLYRCNGINFVD